MVTSNLFDLDFGRWEIILLSLVPAFINLSIFSYVCFFLSQNKTTRAFVAFIFFLVLWQTSEGFSRLSITAETALEWNNMTRIVLSFIITSGIIFVLRFTKWDKKTSPNLIGFLYLPAITCSFFIIAKFDQYHVIDSQYWYWIVNPKQTLFNIIIYLWYSFGALVMLVLLLVFYFKSKKDFLKKNQSLLLLIGLSIPIIIGIIIQIICTLFFGKDDIPITHFLMTFFSFSSLIALKKYKMLDYSPKHQWDSIMNTMNEGVLIIDNHGKIMYSNNYFCKMFGYRFEEIKDKLVYHLFLDNKEDYKGIVTTLKKQQSQNEIKVKTKKGGKLWVRVSGSPYLDINGNSIGFIVIVTNIHRMKHTENILLANKKNLNEMVVKLKHISSELKEAQAIAKIGNWELCLFTNTVTWSEEVCKIHRLTILEDFSQSFSNWLSFIHPEDLERIDKEIKMARSTLSQANFFYRIICKDGTVKNIHSISKFKFNEVGIALALYGICQDVTQLKKSEEKLKEINEEMNLFIYKCSHDLRGPLASVLGLVNVAQMEITDPKSLYYLNIINEQVIKLDSILLTLVKAMSVRDKKLETENIDVNQLIDEILNTLKHTIGFDQIRFDIINLLSLSIFTNRQSLYSILLNLIENSIKYRRMDQIKPVINILIFKKENNLCFEITDNGIGIVEDMKDKVFDMFYRGNTNNSKGSGLGLFLVKITTEKLGGTITLKSNVQSGTKFTVVIPNDSKKQFEILN